LYFLSTSFVAELEGLANKDKTKQLGEIKAMQADLTIRDLR